MEDKINTFMSNAQSFKEELTAALTTKLRFNLNLDTLWTFDPKLADYMLKNPSKGITLFERKLNQMASQI